jgi:hypothetical protein
MIPYKMTIWSENKITGSGIILCIGVASTSINRGRGLHSLQLLAPIVTPRLPPILQVHLKATI